MINTYIENTREFSMDKHAAHAPGIDVSWNLVEASILFSSRRSNSRWSRWQFFSSPTRALVIHAPPGTLPLRRVYPYRPWNFLPTRVRNSRPREGIRAHSCRHFSNRLRRTEWAEEVVGYSGMVLSRRKGWGTDERCEVRQIRVPYFPESRGLPKCWVSLAWAPVTASREWMQVVEKKENGFGYASPRLDWICRRHLSPGMRNSVEKRGSPLLPSKQLWERPKWCKFFPARFLLLKQFSKKMSVALRLC